MKIRMKSKSKFNNRKKILIVASLFSIAFLIYLMKIILPFFKQESVSEDWLVDNCNCFEKKRVFCPEGFGLDENRKVCKSEGLITNVLIGCSLYECPEATFRWNNKIEKWE